MTRAEAQAVRSGVKKEQRALAAAMAQARKARRARRVAQVIQADALMRSIWSSSKKRKIPRQRGRSRLVTAFEAERARATGPRAANACVRLCHALVESASSLWVIHYKRTVISIPMSVPHGATTTYNYEVPDSTDHQIKASFAMCVMHRILFGHAQFALSRFTAAIGMIGGDHDVRAITRAIRLFQEADATVLANLRAIQALAVELLPQSTLTGIELARAAKKSGLVLPSALRRKRVAAYKRKFARTPLELRADLQGIIERALQDFARDWGRSSMSSGGYMPPCAGRCGHPGCILPIVSVSTIRSVLIDGLWSSEGV